MKKRSDTNLAGKPPDLTFFLDNCFGKNLAIALRKAGYQVVTHLERFAADERDEVWLPQVGKERLVVFSRDKKIRMVGIETTALMNAGVRAFMLVSEGLDGEAIERIMLSAMPRICNLLQAHRKAFIAVIYRDATVKIRLSLKDWQRQQKSS